MARIPHLLFGWLVLLTLPAISFLQSCERAPTHASVLITWNDFEKLKDPVFDIHEMSRMHQGSDEMQQLRQKRLFQKLDEINRLNKKLAVLAVNLPDQVPLRLVPLLEHVNLRLKQERVPLRIVMMWDCGLVHDAKETNSEHEIMGYWCSHTLVELRHKFASAFKGRTEAEIRREINNRTIFDLLMAFRMTVGGGMSMLYYEGVIVLTPVVSAPMLQGFKTDREELLRIPEQSKSETPASLTR